MPPKILKKYDWAFWIFLTLFFTILAEAVFGNVSRLRFLSYSIGGVGVDKIAHFLYLGALATLLCRRWGMWPIILSCTALALAIEFLQPYTRRTFDLNDATWGIVGAWFAWGLYQMKWYRRILLGREKTYEVPPVGKFDGWPLVWGVIILLAVWWINRR